MRRPVALLLAALAAACEPAIAPNTHDFGGIWRYTETMTDVPNAISCTATGQYRLTQMGMMFHGDYVQAGLCQTPSGVINNADSGGVANGLVIGRTLRFRAVPYCEYDGALDPGSGRIAGRSLCILVGGGDSLTLHGTWSATRPAP
jgi:hypothetical protein